MNGTNPKESITPKAAHSTSEPTAPVKPKRAPATDEKLADKAGASLHKPCQALKVVPEGSTEVNSAVCSGELKPKEDVKTAVPAKPPKPRVDRLDSNHAVLRELSSRRFESNCREIASLVLAQIDESLRDYSGNDLLTMRFHTRSQIGWLLRNPTSKW